MPTTSRTAMDQAWRTTSAMIRPASGAILEIGRLRSRSKTPLVTSTFNPKPVDMVANRAFCTMIPGIRIGR
jgi:hypothetical protein